MATQPITTSRQQQHSYLCVRLAIACLLPALMASPAWAKKPIMVDDPNVVEVNEMVGNSDRVCQGQLNSPSKLTLPIGKSTLIKLPEPLSNRTIGDPGVLQSKLIAAQTLYVLGVNIGATNMIIQGKSGNCTIVDVTVTLDPDGLQQLLTQLLPDEKDIKVTAAADALVLSGTVEDAITANRVVDIAQAYVRRPALPVMMNGEAQNQNMMQMQTMGQGQQGSRNLAQDYVNPRIVNMLSVSAQQQVMLEVKVAEVSKTLLDKLGASLSLSQTSGSWTYRLLTDFFSTTGSATGGLISGVKSGDKNFGIDAEKRDGLIKILAEPSIMAISGQEGSFLAGGTIFIPVAQNNNAGGNVITLEEKEFGVGVKFTPTVLAGGRINLKVAPEVSELNREGVGISATGFSGTAIFPAFSTRKASTTVQLMDGQSFAIGGLIKNNTTTNIRAFPVLGEIPILGALFRSTEFQKDKTELIFVVTPRLVKPLPSNQVRLPTDNYTDPSRTDLFLKGKMEGPAPAPAEQAPATSAPVPPQTNDTGFDAK